MSGIFTAAEQAMVLIDITVTEAILFIWAFWILEQHKEKLKEYCSRLKGSDLILRGIVAWVAQRK